jgi:hypothetical protein
MVACNDQEPVSVFDLGAGLDFGRSHDWVSPSLSTATGAYSGRPNKMKAVLGAWCSTSFLRILLPGTRAVKSPDL